MTRCSIVRMPVLASPHPSSWTKQSKFLRRSGGAETKDHRLRRCGYGVAWVLVNGSTLNTLGGRAGILYGKNSIRRQGGTPGCGCRHAAVRGGFTTVHHLPRLMFVINEFARGRRRKHLSHADLWERSRCHRPAGPGTHGLEKPRHGGLISPH